MTLQILPDVERLTVTWLRDQVEAAAIFDDRIYTEIPNSPTWPLARITRVGGGPTSRLARLDAAELQLDVWGGPKATAYDGFTTLLALMAGRMVGTHDLGVVSAVEVVSLRWLPDDSFTPARPRYSADVRVWLHP